MDVAGRNVVITGASRGFGARMAAHFAARGAALTLIARPSKSLDQIASRLHARVRACDLSDRGQLQQLCDALRTDPVDVLVNNAGTELIGSFPTQEWDALEAAVHLNLLTPMALTRAVLPGMTARASGHIVNVSSLAGSASFPGMTAYAASKGGLNQFTESLRWDVAGTGVELTLVELGPMRTEMFDRVLGWPPTAAAYERAYRLRALVDVEPDHAAMRVLRAVERTEPHVRLPARTSALAMLPWISRAAVRASLKGLPLGDTGPGRR